jgi:hypothetical protein
LGNVLGRPPKTDVSAWSDPQAENYPLLRSAAWDASERTAEAVGGVPLDLLHAQVNQGSGERKTPDLGRTKHSQMETVSLIREVLWDRAGWAAILFLGDEADSQLPALAPVFEHAEPAGEIFAQWRREIGDEDTREVLRIVIVRGIDKKKPHSYRVIIGAKPTVGDWSLLILVSRVQTMEPSSGQNLERFLSSYQKAGAYHLIHAIIRHDRGPPEPVWGNCILKKELIVRDAWQIGRNDPDMVGISEDDDPIIPTEQANAPVLELLRWRRERAANAKQGGRVPRVVGPLSPPITSPKERAERRKTDRRREKRIAKKKNKP